MLPNLRRPNRMKKIPFILTLLAMVVLPNVALAQEPSERCHFSDGAALGTLEERPCRGGDGTGIEALSAEKESTWASGDQCFQMRFRNGHFNAPSPLQAITESLGWVPVGWCLPLEALLIFLNPLGKIGPMEFPVVTFSG